jgi:hypothetical protein
VFKVLLEQLDLRGLKAYKVKSGRRDLKVFRVLSDLLVPPVLKESKALLAQRGQQVLLGLRVLKVLPDLLVLLALLVLKVFKVKSGRQGRLVQPVLPVLRVFRV